MVQLLREIYQKRILLFGLYYYQGHHCSSSSSSLSLDTQQHYAYLSFFFEEFWLKFNLLPRCCCCHFWSLGAHFILLELIFFSFLSYFLQATGVTAFAHFDEYLRQQRLEAFVEKFKTSVFHRTYYGYEDEDYDPELWEWDELEEEDEEEESQEVDQGIDMRLMVRP